MTLNIRKRMIKSRNQNKNRKKILYLWNENNKEKEDERKKEENNDDNTKKRVTYFFEKITIEYLNEWRTHMYKRHFSTKNNFRNMKWKKSKKQKNIIN